MTKKNFTIPAFIAIAFVIFSTSCANTDKKASEDYEMLSTDSEDGVARGEYLVAIMGCNDCHSPKKMGPKGPEEIPELMLSGYPSDRPIAKFADPMIKQGFAMFYPDLTASAGPWGISFSANLTPDDTGIGTWTEDQFKRAITEGKYKGLDSARMLSPVMPWSNYKNLTDDDVNALFMYLKSIKAVKNIVPELITPDKM